MEPRSPGCAHRLRLCAALLEGLLLTASVVGLAWLDYFAMVYAGLVLLILMVFLVREPHAWSAILKVDAAFALGSVPVMPFLYAQVAYAPGGWQWPDPGEFLPVFLASVFFDDPVWVWGALGVLAGSLLLGAIAKPGIRALLQSRRVAHLAALWAGMTGILLALGLWQPVLYPRYFLVTYPVCFVLLGILLAALVRVRTRWLALVPLLFFVKAALVQVQTVDAVRRQEWGRSVDVVLARIRPGDRVFVLGAPTTKTSYEYLREGNVDGVFYVKNIRFYEYYFRRRGAPAAAAQLEVVEPTVESAEALARRFRGTGKTVYVLAGHHIAFSAAAHAALERAGPAIEVEELFSTLVYTLVF